MAWYYVVRIDEEEMIEHLEDRGYSVISKHDQEVEEAFEKENIIRMVTVMFEQYRKEGKISDDVLGDLFYQILGRNV